MEWYGIGTCIKFKHTANEGNNRNITENCAINNKNKGNKIYQKKNITALALFL